MSGTVSDTHKIRLVIFLWISVVTGPRVERDQEEMTTCVLHKEMMQRKPPLDQT